MENQNADHLKKGALKKAVKKVGKGIKKVGTKAVNLAVGTTVLLPLQPFKPAMKRNLESKGISTKGMSFASIIEKFFNENISKKNKKTSNYQSLEEGYLENHYLMQVDPANFNETDNLAADALVMIVQETIKYFKTQKAKKKKAKEQGQDPKTVLTKTELADADATEKVEAELVEKAESETAVKKGDFSKYIKYIAIIIIIGLAFWFLKKKVK